MEFNFSRGMVRDTPPTQIPVGGCYDIQDLLVDGNGVATKRGNVVDLCASVGDTIPSMVACAPYAADDNRVFAIAQDSGTSTLFEVTTGTASAISGTANAPKDTPKFYIDKLLITDEGGAVPQKVTTGTPPVLAPLGGSPPGASTSCIHLGRYLLANNEDDHPNRLWFSPVPDIEATWDTTNAWIDFDEPVTALASIQGALLVWSKKSLWRVIGDVPPGDNGENMQVQPVAGVGCFDSRALFVSNNSAYFAGDSGVYMVGGAGVTSLTEKTDGTGIGTYWRSLSKTFTTGSVFSLAVFKNRFLHVTYVDSTGPSYYALKCYLPTLAWVRDTGGVAHMHAAQREFDQPERLFAASGANTKVTELTGVFDVATSDDADSDTFTNVLPGLVTRLIGAGTGQKSFGHGHLHYDLYDPAHGSEGVFVQFANTVPTDAVPWDFGILAAASPNPPATAGFQRTRFNVNLDGYGLAVWVQLHEPCTNFSLFGVETQQRQYGVDSEVEAGS